jgi:hypothetical protein
MAEDIIVQDQVQTQEVPLAQQIADQMAISLNGGLAPEVKEVVDNNASQTQGDDQQQQQQAAIVDRFGALTEKFQYAAPEDAIKEIEELRLFKANPTREELKFENDQSKQIFEALRAGKVNEVAAILSQQHKLDSLTSAEVNKDNAAEIIKLGMQLKFKDLTPAEIDYKFNKQFSLPKEPTLLLDETDEDFANRKAEWQDKVQDIEMSKVIEAKLAKPDLDAAKANLKFPEIENNVDEEYVQWKSSIEQQSKLAEENKEAYKKFIPKQLETKLNFNDEANKIAFEFQYEPDAESFNKTVESISNADFFWKNFQNQDGSPNREKFLKTMYFALNAEKVLMEAMKQSKNATLKAQLPDNSTGGLNRQIAQTQEPSELDKLMNQSLAPFKR